MCVCVCVCVCVHVSLTNSFCFLSLSLRHDTCTSTHEDVVSSGEEFMVMRRRSEKRILYLRRIFCLKWSASGAPTPRDYTTVHLGSSEESGKNSDLKWAGHRLTHVFADGGSTASHKCKMTLLEVPTGTLLLTNKDIKQEIVHTLLLEKYGVSKIWVIIIDRRQDKNGALTEIETSGTSAQYRYCARGPEGGAKKQRENGEKIRTCLVVVMFLLRVMTYVDGPASGAVPVGASRAGACAPPTARAGGGALRVVGGVIKAEKMPPLSGPQRGLACLRRRWLT